MRIRHTIFLIISCLLLAVTTAYAQKVGLVLSGGGVRGLAHLGVIKALEEENIPIDFITGTSSGALVGSMYAIGLTPAQMQHVMTRPEFVLWASGAHDEEHDYYFQEPTPDASWVTIKLFIDSMLRMQLPSNVVNPAEIDFGLMERMSGPAAAAGYNFDSLLVPFRCVAADITAKKPVVFGKGDLAQAVRASMAFPFYFSPVYIGDHILYDGGIYNNFPTDVMLKDFNPDIIIGVSAAGLPDFPSEGNFLSQLKTMIQQTTLYAVPRTSDFLIEPVISEIGTFEFDAIQAAIDSGYTATKRMIPQLKAAIARQADTTAMQYRRSFLQNSTFHATVDRIYVEGVNEDQAAYVRAVLNPKNQCLSLEQLKKNWFKLVADDNQTYLFPRLIYNNQSGDYDLHLDVRKKRGLQIDFGGIISSRPVNTGFVSAQYNIWGQQSLRFSGNFYFGKLYNSAQLKMRLDAPGKLPFFLEPGITVNQYDFYKSSNTFFSDVKPSFLVQIDRSVKMDLGIPVRNKGKFIVGANSLFTRDTYYLTRQFSVNDTADKTEQSGFSLYGFFDRNTLNRKMYPNEGTFFEIRGRYYKTTERTLPGSTGVLTDTVLEKHEWYTVTVKYDNYFKTVNWYKAGFYTELNFSGMPFFSNYIASKAQAPAFAPIPEMQTLFIEEFRAHNYLAFGLKNIFTLNEDIDLRLEGYVFQPFQEILKRNNFKPYYGETFNKRYFIVTFNPVYNSPVGPVSLAVNYINSREKPFSVMFNIGYLLFNKKSMQ
ncbi:MAG: patatin-like phospholipase family protein [Bacteroidia bacterium]